MAVEIARNGIRSKWLVDAGHLQAGSRGHVDPTNSQDILLESGRHPVEGISETEAMYVTDGHFGAYQMLTLKFGLSAAEYCRERGQEAAAKELYQRVYSLWRNYST